MTGSARDIANWILANDQIAVCVHFRPDGDAYGTALALCEAARALGKRCFPACDDPVDEKYRFMPGSGDFASLETMPFMPRAVLGADVSEETRMGRLAGVFASASARAVLDHHNQEKSFAPVSYVDENRVSTGELALEVIDCLGVSLTASMATNLYVAISTDSGNFGYQNSSAGTYFAAGRCVQAGADAAQITKILYRTRSLVKTRLIGTALSHLEIYDEGRVAALRISAKMMADAGAGPEDTHNLVNYLNEIEGVRIGFTAEEHEDFIKFSFRAASNANVAALAREFGGGGHIAAAGANVTGAKLDEIFPRAVEAAVRHARLGA